MSDLHRQRRGLSNAELVRRAIEATGLVELALARQDGAQVAANILKVVDLARAFTVSGGGGLRAFTRWLATQQDEEAGEAEASVSEEADDVVRVMTIHAAKGLEFPIVALANVNASPRAPEGPFSDPAAHRVAFRVGTARAGRFATADFESWVEREKQQLEAERLRLLYVALTRARDHLLIPCVPPAEKRVGMLAVLAPAPSAARRRDARQRVDGVHVLDPDSLPATTTVGSAPVPRLDETETAAAVVELEAWSAARASAIDGGGDRPFRPHGQQRPTVRSRVPPRGDDGRRRRGDQPRACAAGRHRQRRASSAGTGTVDAPAQSLRPSRARSATRRESLRRCLKSRARAPLRRIAFRAARPSLARLEAGDSLRGGAR